MDLRTQTLLRVATGKLEVGVAAKLLKLRVEEVMPLAKRAETCQRLRARFEGSHKLYETFHGVITVDAAVALMMGGGADAELTAERVRRSWK